MIIKSAPASETQTRQRIIDKMTELTLERGFSSVTVAELAAELGMSKKTIYVHFPTKQAIVSAGIEGYSGRMRAEMELILGNHMLTFEEKLAAVVATIVEKHGKLRAEVLRDFQRHVPELYRQIESVRSNSIPFLFSRLLEEGRMAGRVREDINLALATEYHLHAVQGLMNPETLARLKLTPAEAGRQALHIFFNGTLIPDGA